ncbi:MAG: hypothetical protein K9G40_03460 [Crocinitomicaceae bacterium]|nr:hypothetical protein [Crocinitomicaceae bacterium]
MYFSTMKNVLFYLFVAFSSQIFSQSDTVIIVYPKNPEFIELKKNDTILIDSPMDGQILFGTMAIPTTSNQIGLYGTNGLWLNEMIGAPCNSLGEREVIDHVESISQTDSAFFVSIQIGSNCCHNFLGDAGTINDTILNLIFIGYGGNCACTCCFGLSYSFYKEEFDFTIPLKWVMINEDRKTLYRIKD